MPHTDDHTTSRPARRRATLLTAALSAAVGVGLGSAILPAALAQTGPAQPDEAEPIVDDPIEPRRIIDIEVQMATAPDLPTYIYRLWSDGAIEMASSAYPPDRFTEWKPLPED